MSSRRLFYSLALFFLLPLILLRLLFKSRHNKDYRLRIKERLGFLPAHLWGGNIIWLHAVSVGETIAVKPLIDKLLKHHPQYRLLVTSTTPTGSKMVKKLFGDRVLHSYFPYDFPYFVRRFIAFVRPQLLIIVETEIWPNLYAHCASKNIPILLVNARLSEKSTGRYLRIQSLVSETLSYVEWIGVRSQQDGEYFALLGASSKQLELVGNIKFDITIEQNKPHQGQQMRKQWGAERPVLVVASTHAGEDEVLLGIFVQLKARFPALLMIVVPRHPERFNSVAQLLSTSPYKMQKRSERRPFVQKTDIILGDSMGEMLLWYAAADIAFIGGSLVKTGGHNPLEATALGLPVVSGQYIFNFSDIYPQLCAAKLAWVEQSEKAIQDRISKLLVDELLNKQYRVDQEREKITAINQRCYEFMESKAGVVDKLLSKIKKYL